MHDRLLNFLVDRTSDLASQADQLNTWELPRPGYAQIQLTDKMCSDRQQVPDTGNALSVTAGGKLRIQYNENGHITFPAPDKPSAGKVYIYGTDSPQAGALFLDIHKVWQASESRGIGDGGALLAQMDFDDQQCYQYSDGTSDIETYRQMHYGPGPSLAEAGTFRFCHNIIDLPAQKPLDNETGSLYTIYWVWDWPSVGGAKQIYTSCLDLHIL